MQFAKLAIAATLTFVLLGCSGGQSNSDDVLPPLREAPGKIEIGGDHHLHVQSQGLIDAIARSAGDMPSEFRTSGEELSAINASEIIAELDAAGIEKGAILSTGYLIEIPEMANVFTADERRAILQAENNFAASQASQFPDRLIAFCAVNPLTKYAKDEVTRCRNKLGMGGIKLHFATADVDLHNPDHLVQLSALLEHAAKAEMPVLVHMATRSRKFGSEDVQKFIDSVVAPLPSLDLYLLHMGGWGSGSPDADKALRTWSEALSRGALAGRANIYFELSASYTRRQDNGTLASLIEVIGSDRIYFGSDWPGSLRPAYGAENFWTHVPIDEALAADILDNRAEFFEN